MLKPLEIKQDSTVFEVTSNKSYEGYNILDKPTTITLTLDKMYNDKSALPPEQNKPNNGLVESSGLDWWVYVIIVSSIVLIIAITIVAIVISKKKKAKAQKQVRTQQYQRPVNQQVRTIPSSTIPTRTGTPQSTNKGPVVIQSSSRPTTPPSKRR